MKNVTKYIIAEASELERAKSLGEPPRCFQNLDVYPFLHAPRIFMEVTDRVKFKRDRNGAGRFVFVEFSIVHSKRKKSNDNSRVGVRKGPAFRSVGAAVARQYSKRSG